MAFQNSAGVGKVFLDNAAGSAIDITQYVPGVTMEMTYDTADSTSLADLGKRFVFGIEDGGETQVDVMLDTGGVMWTQLTGLLRKFGTLTSAPIGTGTGNPKLSREVGITKISTPTKIDGVLTCQVTLKADGVTSATVY